VALDFWSPRPGDSRVPSQEALTPGLAALGLPLSRSRERGAGSEGGEGLLYPHLPAAAQQVTVFGEDALGVPFFLVLAGGGDQLRKDIVSLVAE